MPQPQLQFTHLKPTAIEVRSNVRGPIDPNDPEQKELQASIAKHGILQPLLVMLFGILLAGHRRLAAALMLGLESVPVILTDRMLSDTEIRLIQLAENIHRKELSGYEKWLACVELQQLNPAWQLKELGAHLHLDPSMVTRLLSPSKCSLAWQEALKAGKVGISDCYASSKQPLERQDELLALKLSGASRDQIEKAGRKARTAAPDAVKLSAVRCPLSTGTVVTVRGAEMSLEQLIETLSAVVSAARAALKDRLDIRTFEKIAKDKAKAV